MVPQVALRENSLSLSKIVQGFWRLADWKISNQDVLKIVDTCLELGITTFDHADIYGGYQCETLFGNALAESSVKRESYQLVTKCGIKLISKNRPNHAIKSYDTSKSHILQSVENSLRELRTDYIDLLLIHRQDDLMNADEVAVAFTELKDSGKVKYFGVSNFLPLTYELLSSRLDFPLVTNQIEYSVLNMIEQTNGTLDYCQTHRIKPMAWSPYAGGRLFSEPEKHKAVISVLKTLGEECGGAAIDQIAMAYVMKHPVGFIPILGTGKIDRIQSAVKSLSIELSREQWYRIWEASKGHAVP
jgi:predicted oxidoreductase